MAKPLVADHRVSIRAHLQEMAAGQFTDAEIDAALADALDVLSYYAPCIAKVNKAGMVTTATVIDLSADCPASSVVEIIPAGSASVLDFRVLGAAISLVAAIGATSADIYFRSRWTHDGTNVDYYPQHYRGAVCMLAAGICMNGRANELSFPGAQFMPLAATAQLCAAKLIDYAMGIMQGMKQGAQLSQ
jgi:hypothetical protein